MVKKTGCTVALILGFLLIGLIVTLIIVLVNKKETFSDIDPMIVELHALLTKIHPAASKITLHKAGKSYTVNKKAVHLCLKDEDGEYFNKNMLLYVAIHELAHVICNSVGHTPEFHKINDELLNKAIELGIYNPSIPVDRSYQDKCRL